MLRLAADENLSHAIVRGLVRALPGLDIVSVQDAALRGAADPEVLEWAAAEGRVLLTHDVNTMTHHAYERVRRAQPMPGIVEVAPSLPIGRVIEDLVLLVECSHDGEWEGRILYLPL